MYFEFVFWIVLMTNENISRWTLHYIVEATDGEYTVESEIGHFVFENTSLSILTKFQKNPLKKLFLQKMQKN
mgnify:CR=1 FL=1